MVGFALGCWVALEAVSAQPSTLGLRAPGQGGATGRFLVRSAPGADASALEALHRRIGAVVLRGSAAPGGVQVLQGPPTAGVPALCAQYLASGLVDVAEPDYIVRATATPNDPEFASGKQWSLHNTGQDGGVADADLDASEAWDIRSAAPEVIVAIVDSGIRLSHEDLASNLWVNPSEIAGNGIDDDENGYVDDVHGVNVVLGTGDARDASGHGTHLAGILGAAGNNGRGIAGVAWQLRLMSCRFLDSLGAGNTSDAIAAIDYARLHGARIINASWGGPDRSELLEDAIRAAREAGILVVCGAGNEGLDTDMHPFYPACFDLDNVVSVTASTRQDGLWDQASWGATSVDLAAPGVSIRSAWFLFDNAYIDMAGTSMAAAHVAGACALLVSLAPAESPRQTLERLVAACDPVAGLDARCRAGGRLNLGRALADALPRLTPGDPVPAPAQTVRAVVHGAGGLSYALETSDDLETWDHLETGVVPVAGVREYEWPVAASVLQTFWRARWLP